jgi:GH25 family lysozyme M1 (1,4-beta-N-acetylmuramidase)
MKLGTKGKELFHTAKGWIVSNKIVVCVVTGLVAVGGVTAVALGAAGSRDAAVSQETTAFVAEESSGTEEADPSNQLRGMLMREKVTEWMWEQVTAQKLAQEEEEEAAKWQELYDQGLQLVQDKKYEKAVEYFRKAIEEDPSKGEAYLELAKAYMELEKYDLAKETLEQGKKAVKDTAELETLLKEVEKQIEEEEEQEIVEIPKVEVAAVNDVEDPEPAAATEDTEKGTSTVVNIEQVIEEAEAESSSNSNYESVSRSYGIDVSKWQGSIDWSQVAASGVQFVIIRVGYRSSGSGTIYEDPYFAKNIKGALANGIKVGVYFFSTAVDETEAKEEAAWVCQRISSYQITYPVVYDCEGYNDSSYRTYGIGKTQRSKNAAAFLSYVKGQGYSPMMYASKNAYYNEWDLSVITGCKYWLAHYTSGGLSTESNYTGSYQMWQYSSKGTVSGISGYVDMNVAYFSYSNTPDPTVKTVTYQVTDEAGKPVSGAEVSMTGASSRNTVKATTDGNGKAVFTEVAAKDSYTVTVSSIPAGYERKDSSTVTVEFMKQADSYEGSLSVSRVVCSQITYTVVDEKDNPVNGVTLSLTGTSTYGGTEVSLTATTGTDGKAVFQKVLLGEYTVSVSKTPSGYEIPASPVKDTIQVTSAAAANGNVKLKVATVKNEETQTPENNSSSTTQTTAPAVTETPVVTEPGTTASGTTETPATTESTTEKETQTTTESSARQ